MANKPVTHQLGAADDPREKTGSRLVAWSICKIQPINVSQCP